MRTIYKITCSVFIALICFFSVAQILHAQTTQTQPVVVGTGPLFNLNKNPNAIPTSALNLLNTGGADGGTAFISGPGTVYALQNGNWILDAAGIPNGSTEYKVVYPLVNNGGNPPTSAGNLTLTTDASGNTVLGDPTITAAGAATPVDQATVQAQKNAIANTFGCTSLFNASFASCITYAYYTVILTPAGYMMGLAGLALDQSILYSIVNIKSFISNASGGIVIAWQTIRDLANLVFIGVLIFVAVEAVIGKGDWKKQIANIIIAALLINFSMFITEVVIDASNIISLEFYNSITQGLGTTVTGGSPISSEIMSDIRITTIYQPSPDPASLGIAHSVTTGGTQNWETLLVGMIMGTVLIIVTAFVFLTGAILFIIRLVVLLILLVLSPIAFIGSVLPKLDGMVGKRWRDALTSQAIFAPAYMILMWMSLRILTQLAQTNLANSANGTVVGTNVPSIALLINFMIVTAFMLASVIVAAMLGAEGSALAQKWAGAATFGTAAWIGRNTVGRVSNQVANSSANKWLSAVPVFGGVGRGIKKVGDTVAGSNFDLRTPIKGLGGKVGDAGGKGGFKKEEETRIKNAQKLGDYIAEGDKTGTRTALYTASEGSKYNLLSSFKYGTKGKKDIAEKVQGAWDKKNIDALADKADALIDPPLAFKDIKDNIKAAKKSGDQEKEKSLKKQLSDARKLYATRLEGKKKEEYEKYQERLAKAGKAKAKDEKKAEAKEVYDEVAKEEKEKGGGEEKPKKEDGAETKK